MSCDITTAKRMMEEARKRLTDIGYNAATIAEYLDVLYKTLTTGDSALGDASKEKITALEARKDTLLTKFKEADILNPINPTTKQSVEAQLATHLSHTEVQEFMGINGYLHSFHSATKGQVSVFDRMSSHLDAARGRKDLVAQLRIEQIMDLTRLDSSDPMLITKLRINMEKTAVELITLLDVIKKTGKDQVELRKTLEKTIKRMQGEIARASNKQVISSLNSVVDSMGDIVSLYQEQARWVDIQVKVAEGKLAALLTGRTDKLLIPSTVPSIFDYQFIPEAKETLVDYNDPITNLVMVDSAGFITQYREFLNTNITHFQVNSPTTNAFLGHLRLQALKDLIKDKPIFNTNDPNSVDMVPLGMNGDREAPRTIGVIPENGQAVSFNEAAIAYTGMIWQLNDILAGKYSDGNIPDIVMYSILKASLLDVNLLGQFSSAQTKFHDREKTRVFYEDSEGIKQNLNWVASLLGRNLTSTPLPESRPDWAKNDSKLIAIDIETNVRDGSRSSSFVKDTLRVNTIQMSIMDGDVRTHIIYFRDAVLGLQKRTNSLLLPTDNMQEMTPEDITMALDLMIHHQDQGFKLLSYNGLKYDFAVLANKGDRKKAQAVALRGIDILTNLRIKLGNTEPSLSLKKIAPKLLRGKPQDRPLFFPPEFTMEAEGMFFNGKPMEDIVALSARDMSTPEAKVAFSAYGINDTNLLLDLYTGLRENPNSFSNDHGTFNLREDFSQGLATGEAVQASKLRIPLADLIGDFLKQADSPMLIGESFISRGYDARKVRIIVEELKAAADFAHEIQSGRVALDEQNHLTGELKDKLGGLTARRKQEHNTHLNIYEENMEAVGPLWLNLFNKHGYPLELNLIPMTATSMAPDWQKPYNYAPNTTGGRQMYRDGVIHSMDVFMQAGRAATVVDLLQQMGAVPKNQVETDIAYVLRVLPDLLKERIRGYTDLTDFGNGSLGYMPANLAGRAIIQALMGQEEGMPLVASITVDVLEKEASYQNLSPALKILRGPSGMDVAAFSPFTNEEHETMYQQFRLYQRMRFILALTKLDPTESAAMEVWLNEEKDPRADEQISPSIRSKFSRVAPKILKDRRTFGLLNSREDHLIRVKELMLDAPNLLMNFVHDATYFMPGATSGLFTKNEDIFYPHELDGVLGGKSGFAGMDPGAPIGAVALHGAIQAMTWFFTFSKSVTAEELDIVWASIEAGTKLMKEGAVLDPAGNMDYSFSGKNLVLADILFNKDMDATSEARLMKYFRDKHDTIIEKRGEDYFVREGRGLLVNEVKLGDPRKKAAKLVVARLESLTFKSPTELTLLTKLQALLATPGELAAKELFKGALTPRIYRAGARGIAESMQVKNSELEEDLQLTLKEIEVLSLILVRPLKEAGKTRILVDEALGFQSGEEGEINQANKIMLARLEIEFPDRWSKSAIQQAKATKDHIRKLVMSLKDTYSRGLPRTPDKADKVKKFGEDKLLQYEKIVQRALSMQDMARRQFADTDLDAMNTPFDGDIIAKQINDMVMRELGVTDVDSPMLQQLMARQGVAMKLRNEGKSKEKEALSEDIKELMDMVFYTAQHGDLASGRIIDTGPQSYSAARVFKIGQMWDIIATQHTDEDIQTMVYKQYLMELASNYVPPDFLGKGYDLAGESRAAFYEHVQKDTVTVSRHNQANKSTIDGRYARYRTLLSEKGAEIHLDPYMKGFATFNRPTMALDLTQIPNPSLQTLAAELRWASTRGEKLEQRIVKMATDAVREKNHWVIAKEHRGYDAVYGPQDLMHIPYRASDTSTGILSDFLDIDDTNVMILSNQLTKFKNDFYWDEKDSTVVSFARTMHAQFNKTMRILWDSTDAIEAHMARLDALSYTVGREARRLSKGTYSLDLHLSPQDAKVTRQHIEEFRDTVSPQDAIWLSALRIFGKDIGRMEYLKRNPLINREGVVIRGEAGEVERGAQGGPRNTFSQEVHVLAYLVITSKAFKKKLTDVIKKHNPALLEILQSRGQLDNAGFITDSAFSGIQETDSIQDVGFAVLGLTKEAMKEVIEHVRDNINEYAVEIQAKRSGELLQLSALAGIIDTTEIPTIGDKETGRMLDLGGKSGFVDSIVSNPNTLHAYTQHGLDQLLLAMSNQALVDNVDLALQTNSSLNIHETALDLISDESMNRLLNKSTEEELSKGRLLSLLAIYEGRQSPRVLDSLGRGVVVDAKGYLQSDDKKDPTQGKTTITFSLSTDTFGTKPQVAIVMTRDLAYILPFMRIIGMAREMGLHVEADEMVMAITQMTQHAVDVELESVSTLTFSNSLKMAAVLHAIGNDVNNRQKIADFVQPGIHYNSLKPLFDAAQPLLRLVARVEGNKDNLANKYFHTAKALLSKSQAAVDSNYVQNKILSLFADSDRARAHISAAVSHAVGEAGRVLGRNTVHPDAPFILHTLGSHIPIDGKEPLVTIYPTEFRDRFPHASHLVDFLDALVTKGVITAHARDMKLLMLGTLAVNTPSILDDLAFEDISGSVSLAVASKKAGRVSLYSIGLNVSAMDITPEMDTLYAFAEELMHIARIKYMKESDYDGAGNPTEWNRLKRIFSTSRSTGMIREMILAMRPGSTIQDIDEAVEHAKRNVDEFFAHFGAAVLMRETVFKADTLEALRAKHEPVAALTTWWEKAFASIASIAMDLVGLSNSMIDDAQYGEIFRPMNDMAMSIIYNKAENTEQNSADRAFPAIKTVSSFTNAPNVAYEQSHATYLANKQTEYDQLLASSQTTALIGTALARKDALGTELSNPSINPTSVAGMTLSKVSQLIANFPRMDDGSIDLQAASNDYGSKLVQQTLINQLLFTVIRKDRVDSPGTAGNTFRKLFGEGFTDGIQAYLQGLSQTGLTYNSPLAILTALGSMIDERKVVTEDSFAWNREKEGFEQRKGVAHVMYFPIHVSIDALNHMGLSKVERTDAHKNILLLIAGDPTAHFANPEIETLANTIRGAWGAFHKDSLQKMHVAGMKSQLTNNDPVGVRLRPKDKTTADKIELLTATRDEIAKKLLRSLGTTAAMGRDAMVHTSVLFHAGIMGDPVEAANNPTMVLRYVDNSGYSAITAKEAVEENFAIRAFNAVLADNSGTLTPLTLVNQLRSGHTMAVQGFMQRYTHFVEAALISNHSKRNRPDTFLSVFKELSTAKIDLIVNAYRAHLTAPSVAGPDGQARYDETRTYFGILKDYATPTSYHGTDHLANNFLMDAKDTYISQVDGADLVYSDMFIQPAVTPTNRAIFEKSFVQDIESLGMNLAMHRNARAVERNLVNARMEVPINVSIDTLIDWTLRMAEDGKFQDPTSQISGDTNNIIRQGANRLTEALRSSRGTLQKDKANPKSMSSLYAALATFSRYFLQSNISLATLTVEGVSTSLQLMFGGPGGPVEFIQQALLQYGKDTADALAAIVSDPSKSKDGKILFAEHNKRMQGLSREMVWMIESMASSRILDDTESSAIDGDTDTTGFFERVAKHADKNVSNVSHAIFAALELFERRRIYLGLSKTNNMFILRDAYRAEHALTGAGSNMGSIQRARATAKINGMTEDISDQHIFGYIETGLFGDGVLETLKVLGDAYPSPDGYISVMSYTDRIQTLQGIPGSEAEIEALHSAWNKYSQASQETTKAYAARSTPLDNSSSSHAAWNIFSFWMQYPSLFTQQMVLRNGAIQPMTQFMLQHVALLLLDMAYTTLLMISIGIWDTEKVKKIIKGEDMRNLTFLALRHPLLGANWLGYIMQMTLNPLLVGESKGGVGESTKLYTPVAQSVFASTVNRSTEAVGGLVAIATGYGMDERQQQALTSILAKNMPGFGSALVSLPYYLIQNGGAPGGNSSFRSSNNAGLRPYLSAFIGFGARGNLTPAQRAVWDRNTQKKIPPKPFVTPSKMQKDRRGVFPQLPASSGVLLKQPSAMGNEGNVPMSTTPKVPKPLYAAKDNKSGLKYGASLSGDGTYGMPEEVKTPTGVTQVARGPSGPETAQVAQAPTGPKAPKGPTGPKAPTGPKGVDALLAQSKAGPRAMPDGIV